MVLTSNFDPKDKLLIIHADDVGMCHSENMATFLGFKEGIVSSCSIMMPCPWVLEAVEFFKNNPHYDYGVHSTLTSEWKLYRWKPLSLRSEESTLTDGQGYFYRDAFEAVKASKNDVDAELEAQVKRIFKLGLRPSHLDTHMGVVLLRPDFLESYLKIALKNDLIPMLTKPIMDAIVKTGEGMEISREVVERLLESGIPVLDNLFDSTFGSDLNERISWFRNVLKSIEPGTLTQLIVHLSLPSEEIKAITPSHMERVLDYQLVTSKEAFKIVEELGFTLIGWRDLKGERV
jgi:predicted glycoside hydrolase/deacetylase ChbG (UPF0249 family)